MDRIQKQMLYAAQDYDLNRLRQSRSQQFYFIGSGDYDPTQYTERQFEILFQFTLNTLKLLNMLLKNTLHFLPKLKQNWV